MTRLLAFVIVGAIAGVFVHASLLPMEWTTGLHWGVVVGGAWLAPGTLWLLARMRWSRPSRAPIGLALLVQLVVGATAGTVAWKQRTRELTPDELAGSDVEHSYPDSERAQKKGRAIVTTPEVWPRDPVEVEVVWPEISLVTRDGSTFEPGDEFRTLYPTLPKEQVPVGSVDEDFLWSRLRANEVLYFENPDGDVLVVRPQREGNTKNGAILEGRCNYGVVSFDDDIMYGPGVGTAISELAERVLEFSQGGVVPSYPYFVTRWTSHFMYRENFFAAPTRALLPGVRLRFLNLELTVLAARAVGARLEVAIRVRNVGIREQRLPPMRLLAGEIQLEPRDGGPPSVAPGKERVDWVLFGPVPDHDDDLVLELPAPYRLGFRHRIPLSPPE